MWLSQWKMLPKIFTEIFGRKLIKWTQNYTYLTLDSTATLWSPSSQQDATKMQKDFRRGSKATLIR